MIYFALYQSIYQYDLLVWGGMGDGVLRQLQVNQNNIVRICLNKCTLEGSTRQNYLDLGVLPIRSLYKKIVIIFIYKRLIKKNSIPFYKNKRENRVYDIPVKYSKKSFGQSFVDYLGPTNFNLMPYEAKKNIHLHQGNVKNNIYNWLFLELV